MNSENPRPRTQMILLLILIITFAVTSSHVSAATADKQVLILIGPQYGLPVAEAITRSIVETLQARGVSLDDIYVEYLDLHRTTTAQHRKNLLVLLEHKLEGINPGLIITVNQGAVDFIAIEGKDFFPGVPMMIPILEKDPVWSGEPRQLITLTTRQDATGTLKYALDLFPYTTRALLITGKDDHRAPFLEPIRSALNELEKELQVGDTAHLTYEEMLEFVASLPDNTIAFYGSYFEDITGRSFVPAEVASEVAAVTNSPVFAFRDMHILQRLVGGSVAITEELGRKTAEICFGYIAGEIHLTQQTTNFEVQNVPLFNWQEIRRFGGNPRRLPADTLFLSRPDSVWESHREAVITAAGLMSILAILAIVLFVRNRQLSAARKALNEYSRNLSSLVASRTQELEVVNKELESFSYSVSHDLRAPLRALSGFSSVLVSKYGEDLDDKGRHYLARIREASERMGKLIDDLMKLSRITRAPVDQREVDLSAAAKKISEELQALDPERTVEWLITDGLVANGDPDLLSLLLRNLLENSLKFTRTVDSPRIEFSAEEQGGNTVFFVRDNGVGFDNAYADKLFVPFQRLHSDEEFFGTGIGLATVQRILTRNEGLIWAEGEVDKGATFSFTLRGGRKR